MDSFKLSGDEVSSGLAKKTNLLLKIFSGVKRMPSSQTLRFVSPEAVGVQRYLPWGIDLGTSSLKLIQLGIVKDRPQVINFIIEELPQELKENPLERKKSLPQILKKITQENKIRGETVTSLPSALVQIKKIKLPPMPQGEVDSALRWEFKQTSTVALEELCYDYYFLGENSFDGSREIEMQVVSCPKREALDHLAIIQAAGLIPAAVETDCLASVFPLIHNLQIKKEETVLFLDFGYSSCSISVIIKNQVYFKRELAINGDSLTQAISKNSNLPYEQAERLKLAFGLLDSSGQSQEAQEPPDKESPIMVNEALWLHLENLIQEIDYTFKYFSHQLSAGLVGKFDRIILSGGSANLRRFPYYLNNYLGVPVEIAEPLRGFSLSPEASRKLQDLPEVSPQLSVAMGLAMRGL